MTLSPDPGNSADPPTPVAVPSSTRLDWPLGFGAAQEGAYVLEGRAATPVFLTSEAVPDSDSGRRRSRNDLVARFAVAVVGDHELAIGQRPREHRRRADDDVVLIPDRRLGRLRERLSSPHAVDKLAAVPRERGGNESPQSRSYAGLR